MSLAAPLSPLKMAMTPLVLMDSVVFAAVALAALAARLLPSTFAEGWPVTRLRTEPAASAAAGG